MITTTKQVTIVYMIVQNVLLVQHLLTLLQKNLVRK